MNLLFRGNNKHLEIVNCSKEVTTNKGRVTLRPRVILHLRECFRSGVLAHVEVGPATTE